MHTAHPHIRTGVSRMERAHKFWTAAYMVSAKLYVDEDEVNDMAGWEHVTANRWTRKQLGLMELEMCVGLGWRLKVEEEAVRRFETYAEGLRGSDEMKRSWTARCGAPAPSRLAVLTARHSPVDDKEVETITPSTPIPIPLSTTTPERPHFLSTLLIPHTMCGTESKSTEHKNLPSDTRHPP
ncbi:hypothetical protein BDQ12DRAFT_675563 [Crucibulum laeve]|uniref:Cyclin N-terminal domain-containing protein n=1 Tax=Crucibulum laeve TaxID=68775 RepID=A0A5C3MFU0_9AGAR|nr:hypothetical protein BDQ12DRAFT_675563 [Crucibulum laeve]